MLVELDKSGETNLNYKTVLNALGVKRNKKDVYYFSSLRLYMDTCYLFTENEPIKKSLSNHESRIIDIEKDTIQTKLFLERLANNFYLFDSCSENIKDEIKEIYKFVNTPLLKKEYKRNVEKEYQRRIDLFFPLKEFNKIISGIQDGTINSSEEIRKMQWCKEMHFAKNKLKEKDINTFYLDDSCWPQFT